MVVINISWEFFFGIVGTLIALAYYANGRLTRLETSVDWLKKAVEGLTQAWNAALPFGKKRAKRKRV